MTKVLVVDDEPAVREFLDIFLSEEGYDVLLAENGWEGLKLYCREQPDVILLDLGMPGLDGAAVLKHIHTVDPNQLVIVFTGDSNPETKQLVYALGANEFIEKGDSLHLLTKVLQRHLKPSTLASVIPIHPPSHC
jgi:CheY-like chemotaxis protein